VSKIFEALSKAQQRERVVEEPVAPTGDIVPLPELEDPVLDDVENDVWREFEVLRSGIEGHLGTLVDKTIAFMSSVPGEGTTTVAARFALSLRSLRWVRPILVDMNLRNPSVRAIFDLPPMDGVVEVLTGKAPIGAAAVRVADGALSVLCEGRGVASPQALFTPKNVARFLGEVRESYNCVILDAPAVLGHAEAKVIGGLADGVVLVIETSRTKREVALRSKEALSASRTNIIGTVLNKRKYVIPALLYKRI
jgi:Mrp family chromosome partitioning ATPase